MAEANQENNANPPASSGGLTKDDVKAIVADALGAAITPITDNLKSLGENQRVLADTLKALPPAGLEKKASEGKEGKEGAATITGALTADEAKKMFAELLAANSEQQQTSAAQAAARKAFIAKPESGLAKLHPALQAKLGVDPAKWADEAKAITQEWETYAKSSGIPLPDVGGASKDGGVTPAASGGTTINTDNLKPGTAALAREIKLPA